MAKGNKTLYLLGFCLAGLVAVMVFVPDFFRFNLGYKNREIAKTIPNEIDTDRLKEQEFTLPVIYLYSHDISKLMPDWVWTADGPHMPLREESKVDVYVFDRNINKLSDIPSHVYYGTYMKLRGRTSSYQQQKKPFSMEFRNEETGESLNYPFLSLPAESDFVFHAPYIDRSLIRNYLAYNLQAQVLDWAPQAQFAEVFIDTPDSEASMKDYGGVYLIVQKIKKGKNGIAIGEFKMAENPENQFEKGGNYIFKLDAYEPGYDTAFRFEENKYGNRYSLVYPKGERATQQVTDTIYNEIQRYEQALYEGSFEELDRYYDLEELAECMLVSEYMKNMDGFMFSTFFYRSRGGKIKPVAWDFDIAAGNRDYAEDLSCAREFHIFVMPYVEPFLQHEEFVDLLVEKWQELRSDGGVLCDENVMALIDKAEAQLEGAWQRNDESYPDMWTGQVYSNSPDNPAQSSQDERDYLRKFLVERGRWLDENLGTLGRQ